ncbi:hypothetical protein SAMN02910384_01572 [Pseudobutyrivibrio sp. ACV-2]|uniref:hypothetical protein n=1 Tax=Pseudobutyrivibrio sp. ACV-2 TaxID=1520801 RepID=UPI0008975027|nr:hypothetical protein [Pseudobutyrivibrio sp. ACV-2]SEA47265.1 hypothetical protein SAMN02910384_01572 [Pseudobutyrivibrio sp. ACV-2]
MVNNNKNNKKTKRKQICVVGVSPKSGVTHICLSLANFIHSVLRQKVIYIEHRADSSLLGVVGENQVKIGELSGYKYKGVNYVLTNDVSTIYKLMSQTNCWIIIDMSKLTKETKTIFNNCNRRIVIGSLRPWCERDYYRFIDKNIEQREINQVKFYNINKQKNKNHFKQIYGQNLYEIPYIEDPFSLKEEEFDGLIDMLQ